MRAVDVIRKKRDGEPLRAAEIEAFVRGAVAAEGEPHRWAPYQVSALLMAIVCRGMTPEETAGLTAAMVRSGERLDLGAVPGPKVDKHSTGGVGDKVSLVLAPLAAACGVVVPMVAGRGLGHTGGTLDKLEAIPGFDCRLSPEAFGAQLERLGVAMIGQGADLVPADGLLYSLRDVTATVEFEPFLVSSIVSKKVAEGARALVYDVKCGNGAFMKDLESASHLAHRLVGTTRGQGVAAVARVTDMSQPLGRAAGNALEVEETLELLRGRGPEEVRELTLECAAAMLVTSGAETDRAKARSRATAALDGGQALEKFFAMAEAQGGDAGRLEREGLAQAPVRAEVLAGR